MSNKKSNDYDVKTDKPYKPCNVREHQNTKYKIFLYIYQLYRSSLIN